MKQQLELSHETTVSVTSAWSFVKQLRPLSLPIKIVTTNIFQSDVHTVGFVCWKSGICNGHRAEKNKKNRLLEVLRLMDANDSQIEI